MVLNLLSPPFPRKRLLSCGSQTSNAIVLPSRLFSDLNFKHWYLEGVLVTKLAGRYSWHNYNPKDFHMDARWALRQRLHGIDIDGLF